MDRRRAVSRGVMLVGALCVALGSVLLVTGRTLGHTFATVGAVMVSTGWVGRAAITVDEAFLIGYEAGRRRGSVETGRVLPLQLLQRRRGSA